MSIYYIEKKPPTISATGGSINFPYKFLRISEFAQKIPVLDGPSLGSSYYVTPEIVKEALPSNKKELNSYFSGDVPVAIVTHPNGTSTCPEKIYELLGLEYSPEMIKRTIKCIVFQHKGNNLYYFFIIPGKKAGVNVELQSVKDVVAFSPKNQLRLVPESELPFGMQTGTCTPFLPVDKKHEIGGILFDNAHLLTRQSNGGPDDLSVAIGFPGLPDHNLSVFMNYSDLFKLMKDIFGEKVCIADIRYDMKKLAINRFGPETEGLEKFFKGIEYVQTYLKNKDILFEIVQTNIIPDDGKWLYEHFGIKEKNLLKTVYYGKDRVYGLVIPSTDLQEVINYSLEPDTGISIPRDERLARHLSNKRRIVLPPGSYYDAITPFLNNEAKGVVKKIIFSLGCNFPENETVAISLGLAPGYPEGQRTFLLLPFGALKEIVKNESNVQSRKQEPRIVCHNLATPFNPIYSEYWKNLDALILETSDISPKNTVLVNAIKSASVSGTQVFLISNTYDSGLNVKGERIKEMVAHGAIPLVSPTKDMKYLIICAISDALAKNKDPAEASKQIKELFDGV